MEIFNQITQRIFDKKLKLAVMYKKDAIRINGR